MLNGTRTQRIALTLFWIIFGSSCSSLAIPSVPPLEHRTLRLSKDVPGFEYQFEVCKREVLGVCISSTTKVETYDLRDLALRTKLIDMGFVARVRDH